MRFVELIVSIEICFGSLAVILLGASQSDVLGEYR